MGSPNTIIGKIEVDRDLCIGAGPCEVLANETFKIINGKAEVIENWNNTDEEILNAAQACPVLAIKIYDKSGKLIYPK